MAKNKYNYYLVDGTVLWRQKVDNEYKAEFFSYGEWYEDSIYTAKLEDRCSEISEVDALKYVEEKIAIKKEQMERAKREEQLIYNEYEY